MKKEKPKSSELKIDIIKKLKEMKIPEGWEVAQLQVVFEKKNVPYPVDRQRVTYDSMNNCFYLQTPRQGNIYPGDMQGVIEGVEIMKKANSIIK